MSKYVLGIYRGHDSSVALVGEGRIFHLEMERFTRKKHDGGAIDSLLTELMKQSKVNIDEIVAVAGIGPIDDMGLETEHNRPWWSADIGGLKIVDECSGKLFGRKYPCYYMPHHAAHAAYAFYTSNSESVRSICIDGGGDAWCDHNGVQPWVIDAGYGVIKQPFGSGECEWGFDILPQVQIGGRWNEIAERLFGSWHCAGSVMALGGVPIGEYVDEPAASEIRTLQDDTTQVFHRIADMMPRTERTIALSGGCALNGIAAYSLLQRSDVDTVHVPPAVHDGGLTVGAAMMVLHRVLGVPRVRYNMDTVAFAGSDISFNDNIYEYAERIVGRLVKGKVVALAVGQAESGPRALGHRSFLADPRSLVMKDRINQIKGRQPWRPVAPAILLREAGKYFNLINNACYDYMTMIASVTDRAKAEIPAAIHYDNTARVQVVSPARDRFLYCILAMFHETTGCPALLNTSFNLRGEAICNTAEHAKDTFRRSGADMLVVGDTAIER